MSLLIDDNLVVSMHYKLSDDDGNVLDTSEGATPLTYLHGAGNIIPGLENALKGKTEGDNVQVKVQPADGYGEVNPELVQVVQRESFQGVEKVEAGMAFEAQRQDGSAQRIVVTKVDGDNITIDANHALAGRVLHFDVDIVEIRDATKEELDHGHVH